MQEHTLTNALVYAWLETCAKIVCPCVEKGVVVWAPNAPAAWQGRPCGDHNLVHGWQSTMDHKVIPQGQSGILAGNVVRLLWR